MQFKQNSAIILKPKPIYTLKLPLMTIKVWKKVVKEHQDKILYVGIAIYVARR